jgi:hypothetical protein
VVFFRSEPGRRSCGARPEASGRCQRVLMIANMLEGWSMRKRRGWLAGAGQRLMSGNRYEEDVSRDCDRPRPGR